MSPSLMKHKITFSSIVVQRKTLPRKIRKKEIRKSNTKQKKFVLFFMLEVEALKTKQKKKTRIQNLNALMNSHYKLLQIRR